jgi:hypothetical protein
MGARDWETERRRANRPFFRQVIFMPRAPSSARDVAELLDVGSSATMLVVRERGAAVGHQHDLKR